MKIITNYNEAMSVEEDNFTSVWMYTRHSGPFGKSENRVNESNFLRAEVRRYKHPKHLSGAEAAKWCAQNGVEMNATEVHDIGHRAGERSGYASEKMPNGRFEAVKYGPAGYADGKYPYGTKRTVL